MSSYDFLEIKNGRPALSLGAMRHQITLLEQSVVAGASGSKETWLPGSPPKVARAAIANMPGSDQIRAGQTATQQRLMVGIWFQPGFVGAARIQHSNGSKYIIESVENILEMDVVLVLNCLGLGANT